MSANDKQLYLITLGSMAEISCVIEVLRNTIDGNGEAIESSQLYLEDLRQKPEFFEVIFSVLFSNEAMSVKQSAAIQILRFVEENEDFLHVFGINEFAEIYKKVPDQIQKIFEKIALRIIESYISKDELGSIIENTVNLISNSDIVGFVFLGALAEVDPDNFTYENHSDYFCLLCPALEIAISIISSTECISDCIHYTAFSFRKIIIHSEISENMDLFIQYSISNIVSIMSSGHSRITKDLIKSIEKYLSVLAFFDNTEIFSTIPDIIVTVIQNSESSQTITSAIRVLEYFFSDELYQFIENKIESIIFNCILPVLSKYVSNIDLNDHQYAIESLFPPFTERCTPLSATGHVVFTGASRLCSSFLEALSSIEITSSSYLYVLLFTLSSLIHVADQIQTEQITSFALELLDKDDPLMITSALLVFSYANASLIPNCNDLAVFLINSIVSINNDVIKYYASTASANILRSENVNKQLIIQQVGDNTILCLKTLFEIGEAFSSEHIAQAIVSFTGFFSEAFVTLSSEFITVLVSLFKQYAEDDRTEARQSASQFCEAIKNVCDSVSHSPDLIVPLVEGLIKAVFDFIEEGMSTFNEEFISILSVCVNDSPHVTESFVQIPNILLSMFENDGIALVEEISHVFMEIACKFPVFALSEEFVEPVTSIVMRLFEDPEELALNEWDSLVILFQVLFIKLKSHPESKTLAQSLLQTLENCDLSQTKDIVSSFACIDPISTFESATLFESWIENTSPTMFILSAKEVICVWDQLPASIKHYQASINKKLSKAYSQIKKKENKYFKISSSESIPITF